MNSKYYSFFIVLRTYNDKFSYFIGVFLSNFIVENRFYGLFT